MKGCVYLFPYDTGGATEVEEEQGFESSVSAAACALAAQTTPGYNDRLFSSEDEKDKSVEYGTCQGKEFGGWGLGFG